MTRSELLAMVRDVLSRGGCPICGRRGQAFDLAILRIGPRGGADVEVRSPRCSCRCVLMLEAVERAGDGRAQAVRIRPDIDEPRPAVAEPIGADDLLAVREALAGVSGEAFAALFSGPRSGPPAGPPAGDV